MSERPAVKMKFADGSSLSSFISLSHTEKFSSPIDEMRFVCAPPRDGSEQQVQEYRKRLRTNEIVAFLVNDRPQAACYLTEVGIATSASGGIVFSCVAKSPLQLLHESTVPYETEAKALASDKPILDLVASVCEPFGLGEVFAENDIAVIKSKTGRAPKGLKATPVSQVKYKNAVPQPNESCYQFLNRILSRLGLILRCDAVFGGLYITRPHYDQAPLYKFEVVPSGRPGWDTFEGATMVRECSENQFSFVEAHGVSNDDASSTHADRPLFRAYSAAINGARPPFRAGASISHKPCYYRDTSCQTKQQAKGVALLVMGERAEEAFSVTGSVPNLVSREGVPFAVDTMASIYLPQIGIDEDMWLAERTMTVSAQDAVRTDMRFIPKGYYQIGELPS